MTPQALVKGRNPKILEESVLQTLGAQPASFDLARNEPDVVHSPKNYSNIRLAAMGVRLVRAMRGHLIVFSVAKASLVYSRHKDSKRRSGGTEKFLVKFIPKFRSLGYSYDD